MKYFPFLFLSIWLVGFIYIAILWVVSIDVMSVSILFGVLMGLIALGAVVVQLILSRHLFHSLRKFIIMNKIKTPKPKQSETDTKPVKTPKPKPKYRDVENNR
jgi:hypothetical protein